MKLLKSSRERILAGLFAACAVAVGLSIGGGKILARQAFLQDEISRLRNESLELRSWIAERDSIRAQQQWTEQHLPQSDDIRKNGLEFLQRVEEQAKLAGGRLEDKSILDPESNDTWTAVPVRVSLRGKFSGIVKLLHEIQQPGDFVIVRNLVVKAGGEDQREVAANMELLKIFRPKSP